MWPGEKQNSFAPRLRRREILEPVEQHDAIDVVLGVPGKVREFRRHPSELPHHAANGGAALFFAPLRKRQLQIFRRGRSQTRPHPEEKRGGARAHKSCEWTRHRANRFEQRHTAAYSKRSRTRGLYRVRAVSRTGFRACVATRLRAGQRLKPNSFCILHGTVETVPYEDLPVATLALQPVFFFTLEKVKTRQAELSDCSAENSWPRC